MSLPDQPPATGPEVVQPAAQWQEANAAWLSAAVAHLRLRLEAMAPDDPTAGPAPQTPAAGLWRVRPSGRVEPAPAPATRKPTWSEIDAARRKRDAAMEAMDPKPALHVLGDRLDLSAFEREVLLLCAAVEFDTRIAALCAAAQGEPGRSYPTFALALALFDEPAWDVMSAARPLRYWRLIEINQPGTVPLTAASLRADDWAVHFLKGLSYLDDRLLPLMAPLAPNSGAGLPPSQERAVAEATRQLRAASDGAAALVQLVASDTVSAEIVAQQTARALKLTLFKMQAALLPRAANELETLARLWHRDSILMPIALYLDGLESLGTGGAAEPPVAQLLERSGGVFLVGTREARGDLGPMVQAVRVDRPTSTEQAEIWTATLPGTPTETIARLAGQFDLNAPAIQRIARTAGGAGAAAEPALWQRCIETSALRMDGLTEPVRPVARWEDIVLPDQEMALLRQLAAQVRHRSTVYGGWGFGERLNRGLGIGALFAGDSGTGKTMAAEVIANALDLRLYRIDLSAVVSKYIGETEKNLRKLFDAAEGGGSILFFDEADALFGKRSEVRDSHDRYANIETSYLLQRVESFRGLAILSTNMRNALDTAFLRRLRFVVTFPFPGPPQRRAIWERAFPPGVPREGLDYDRLARLNLAGGNITTVALNAAFMAADTGGPVTMALVLKAARAEYGKLERTVNEADFRALAPMPIQEARST